MAAPAVTRTEVLSNYPFVITRLTVTSGADATALLHGGPSTPIAVVGTLKTASTLDSTFACTAKSDTTITLDFGDDGNDTWEVVCLFLDQAAQDGTTVTVS